MDRLPDPVATLQGSRAHELDNPDLVDTNFFNAIRVGEPLRERLAT